MKDFLKGLDCPYKNKFHTMKPFGEYVVDETSGRSVYHVRSLPLLIQAVGSVKYNLAKTDEQIESGWRVYFRGQSSLLPIGNAFMPSAYRAKNGNHVRQGRVDERIGTQIKILQENLESMKNLDKRVVEGVLQHYGLRSRWIDAVDNIWTALWFACHIQLSGNKNGECVHYVRRDSLYERAENKYCYILLLGIDTNKMKSCGIPGFIGNEMGEVLDLRYAIPSYYIRPHIQHGILVRLMERVGKPLYDMSPLLQSVVRIDLDVALQLIDRGLSVESSDMFPPPAFDTGLDELFRTERKIEDEILRLLGHEGRSKEEEDKLSRYKKNRIVLQRVC